MKRATTTLEKAAPSGGALPSTATAMEEAPCLQAYPDGDLPVGESEARYRRLFETAQDAILILDGAGGKIMDANPFVINLLGFRWMS